MINKAVFLLLLSLVLLPLYASAGMPGGWNPIPDVKSPDVVKVGEFAVSEHNKQTKSGLKLMTIVKGWSQVVAGVNYRLVIEANDGVGKTNYYEAIVLVNLPPKPMNLTSFTQLLQ